MVIKIQDLMENLMGTPVGAAALADLESDRLTRRLDIVEEVAAIRAESAAKRPELQKLVEKAEAKVESTWQAYQLALQGRAQAHGAFGNSPEDRRVAKLEGELQATADIDTIRAFLGGTTHRCPKPITICLNGVNPLPDMLTAPSLGLAIVGARTLA